MQISHPELQISQFTYGTGRIGMKPENFVSDVKTARAAMEAGVWFHTSDWYNEGRTCEVLRQAFKEAPSQRPRLIVKLDFASVDGANRVFDSLRTMMDVEKLDFLQLCGGFRGETTFADDFRAQGPRWQWLNDQVEKGIVDNLGPEVWIDESDTVIASDYEDFVDATIFYHNPLDRHVSAKLYAHLRSQNRKMLALRTLGSRYVDFNEEIDPSDSQATMISGLKPIYDNSGCQNWTEFCVRYTLSVPGTLTTIGATQSIDRLNVYLEAVRSFVPLESALVQEIDRLHDTVIHMS